MPAAETAATAAPAATSASAREAVYQFARGRLADGKGDYREALTAFAEAVRLAPGEPYLRLEYARLLTRLGQFSRDPGERRRRFELAREQLAAVDVPRGGSPELWKETGLLYLDLVDGDADGVEKARQALEEARRAWPEDPEVLIPLGQIYRAGDDLPAAADTLRHAVESVPGNAWVQSLLERVLVDLAQERLGKGETAGAESLLREALALDPLSSEARSLLAELASGRGEHREAVEILRGIPAERLPPDLARRLVWELFQAGELDDAARLAEGLEVDDEGTAGSLQILLLAARGRLDEAADSLAELVDGSAGHTVVIGALARALASQGRSDVARDLLQRVVERLSRESERESEGDGEERAAAASQVRLELARLAAAEEAWEEVVAALAPLAEGRAGEGGESGVGWRLLHADALIELGRAEEALAFLPSRPPRKSGAGADREASADRLVAKRAEILFRLGREEEGQQALASLGRESEAVLASALVYQRLERYLEAIPLLEELVGFDPASVEGLYFLGSAYERTGSIEASVETFRNLLELSPDFAPALNYLGYLWAERGENLAEALALAGRAVSLDPENGAYVDSLGWAHFQLGNYSEALTHLERAASLLPDDATIFEHLGDAYVALGRLDRAQQVYQRSLELGDDNAEAVRRKLESLGNEPPGR